MAEIITYARAICSAIYAAIWTDATPAPLEPARGEELRLEGFRLEGFRLERRRLEFPTAALARLGEQFFERDLTAAGVAVRDADGELIPAAPLRQACLDIVALRERPGDAPFDLLTPLGCLSGAESVLAMLRDFRSRARISDSLGYLYIALDWVDALWCDATGLATLYCPGAGGLTVPLLRALAADLTAIQDPLAETACAAVATLASDASASDASGGGESDRIGERPEAVAVANSADDQTPDAAEPDADVVQAAGRPDIGAAGEENEARKRDDRPGPVDGWPAPALAVVAWSPGAWSDEQPAGLADRLCELAKVEQALGDGFPEMIVWSPPPQQLERLQLIERYGDGVQLRRAIAEGVETAGRVLSALALAPLPENFIAARAALRRAVQSGDDRQIAALKSHYDRFLQREFVEPLLALGAGSADPLVRARYLSAAELFEQLHHAARAAAPFYGSPTVAALIDGGGARHFLALAKLLVQLLKSLGFR